jgi:two-component system capsular synthesis response regulator RcsB
LRALPEEEETPPGLSILLADDHPLLLAGVSTMLEHSGVAATIRFAANASGVVAQLKRCPFDILITDYSMPDTRYGDGLQMLSYMRRHYPQLPVMVLTLIDNPAVLRAIQRLRILGIVSKRDPATLISTAALAVARGRYYLSPAIEAALRNAESLRGRLGAAQLSNREIEVLRLYAEGRSVSEIAEQLKRSIKTVSGQKKSAFNKLGVGHDSELIRYAFDSGLCTSVNMTPDIPG